MNEIVGTQARRLPYDSNDFDYGQNTLSPSDMGRARLRRRSRALPFERARIQRRADRILGRQLLPRARGRHALRVVGARLGGRHGGRPRRGVSLLPRVLDREARAGRAHAAHVRAARLAARQRRLSVRHDAGRRDRRRGPHAPLSARARRHARHRAAHEHVPVRREPAASNGLPARGPRLGRPHGCDR